MWLNTQDKKKNTIFWRISKAKTFSLILPGACYNVRPTFIYLQWTLPQSDSPCAPSHPPLPCIIHSYISMLIISPLAALFWLGVTRRGSFLWSFILNSVSSLLSTSVFLLVFWQICPSPPNSGTPALCPLTPHTDCKQILSVRPFCVSTPRVGHG